MKLQVHRPSTGVPSRLALALIGAAGALAASAIFNESAARRAERKYPPHGRFIEVGGVRLHLLDTGGSGSPVILLHGNGATSADMEISGLLGRLSKTHRVLAFDRPGFGFSTRPRYTTWTPEAQADLIAASLDRLGIGKAIVIAHSWGTLVATALALRHPQRIAKLVLVSGYYFPARRAGSHLPSPPSVPWLGDLLSETVSPLLGRVMTRRATEKVFAPRHVPQRFWREFPFELSLRPSQLHASAEEALMMNPAAARLAVHYASIKAPVAIIAGSDDGVCDPNWHSKALHKAIPQSSLHIIPGFGHMVHYGASNVIAWAIDLDTHATRRPAPAMQATPA